MNRNEYRRALVMMRSLRAGVSGYVRLERRTLMGTLQFTVNGAPSDGALYAILLYRNGGAWSAIRLDAFSAPRYGQTGLVWRFDPRNIEGRTLEQYDLAAVIEIRNGTCDLILCGNLNGSVEADWAQIREAACRLFSPVRISGAPISPIDEKNPEGCAESGPSDTGGEDEPQVLPDFSEETPAYPGDGADEMRRGTSDNSVEEGSAGSMAESIPEGTDAVPDSSSENASRRTQQTGNTSISNVQNAAEPTDRMQERSESSPSDESMGNECSQCAGDTKTIRSLQAGDELDCPAGENGVEQDEFDMPAADIERDELDMPAAESPFMNTARAALSGSVYSQEASIEPDELDMPAQEAALPRTAGDLLELDDPAVSWPQAIEPLRILFFSSESVEPFEAQGYVFINAPMPEESGMASCVIGLHCDNGVPSRVCYALPSIYSPEPPAGLEGYVWRGDQNSGYWVICEDV